MGIEVRRFPQELGPSDHPNQSARHPDEDVHPPSTSMPHRAPPIRARRDGYIILWTGQTKRRAGVSDAPRSTAAGSAKSFPSSACHSPGGAPSTGSGIRVDEAFLRVAVIYG